YGDLRDAFGHFPLKHFWGPLAGIESSRWIAASAVEAAGRFRPDFHFIYLPHLDYAAQKHGPDSPEAEAAAVALDREIAGLIEGLRAAYRDADPVFVAASEYVITPVEAVACPNRVLREAGLLAVTDRGGEEHIDFASTPAWAMADHQIAHVFVEDAGDVTRVADALREADIAAAVLTGRDRADVDLDHPRSGDVVLLSRTDASFAYPWWFDDGKAPAFARIVDIHRKPGYDPVELFFDPATKSIPLDPSLVRGSHGLPTGAGGAAGVCLASDEKFFGGKAGVLDHESLAGTIRRHFA
ncbi:MAG: alkaline phosphatase family protein, partial [Planctomycetota bacterium]